MPIIPNILERFLLLKLNQAPSALIDVFSPAGLRAVILASDIGVFDALENRPMTVDDLAERTSTDSQGLRHLLGVLEPFGYLRSKRGHYSNTRQTSKWLLNSSPAHFVDFLRWWQELVYKFWDANFEMAIREGAPRENLYEWISTQPNGWEIAQAGFEAAARITLDAVVSAIDLPRKTNKLLDLGGGHGLYSIELCKRYPQLNATILDLPLAMQPAERNIEQEGMKDRIELQGGDYLQDDLGGPHDAVLLFNVIHAHEERENAQLLRRVGASLKAGGRVYVMDQMSQRSIGDFSKGANRMVTLAYFVGLNGRTYTFDEVKAWMVEVGFEEVRQSSMRSLVDIVSATWLG